MLQMKRKQEKLDLFLIALFCSMVYLTAFGFIE